MITDDMLQNAAIRANDALLHTLPCPKNFNHTFSRRFEHKMRKLINHTKYPMVYKLLKAAACFLLISGLTAFMYLTTNVKARESFFDWIKAQYEHFIEYYFDGMVGNETIDDNELVEYRLGWVPEGYAESEVSKNSNKTIVIYSNGSNEWLQFSYYINPASTNLLIGQNPYGYSTIKLNNLTAEIYISDTPNESNGVVWFNESKNILFNISAFLPKEDLIKMAENIVTGSSN